MNSKEYFFNETIAEALKEHSGPIRVLELGCGTAPYVPALIAKYPELEYVGIEPIKSSFDKAKQNLRAVPRTKISLQLGYDEIPGLEDASFDVVISFSVLEHVKQLERFMKLSARYVKKGGLMVHRYDLGHALYPTSLKEKVHVWIGNTFPSLLPERTFVRYVPQTEVSLYYEKFLGTKPYRYTYHQMPNAKMLVKMLDAQGISNKALTEIYAWEFTHASDFAALSTSVRERLFPSIALWGKK